MSENLDFDWDDEPEKNTIESARELYQSNEQVRAYDFSHTDEFADDYEDDCCSSWYEDYEIERREHKMEKQLKKQKRQIKKLEKRVSACETDVESLKPDVAFLKHAHKVQRRKNLYSQLIHESDINKRRQLSDELLDDGWDGDDIDW